MLEVLVPKKSFNRYQNFQCCALRALALVCVKLFVYFSIKTYFSYFTKTFSKNINISLCVLKIYFNIILKFSLFFINSFILLSLPFSHKSQTLTTATVHCHSYHGHCNHHKTYKYNSHRYNQHNTIRTYVIHLLGTYVTILCN